MLQLPEARKWKWKHSSKENSGQLAVSALIARCRVKARWKFDGVYVFLSSPFP